MFGAGFRCWIGSLDSMVWVVRCMKRVVVLCLELQERPNRLSFELYYVISDLAGSLDLPPRALSTKAHCLRGVQILHAWLQPQIGARAFGQMMWKLNVIECCHGHEPQREASLVCPCTEPPFISAGYPCL